LGELFEIGRGGSPRPISAYVTDDPDGINWISISDASESSKYIYRTARRIKPSGVSVETGEGGRFSPHQFHELWASLHYETTGCIHDGWLVLSDKNGRTDPEYLYHILSSDTVYRQFEKLAAGVTVKNLNIDLVSGIEIPLPPLKEQRRIAAILDAADALRQKRRQALRLLDQLTQAIFVEMFGDPLVNSKGWENGALLGEHAEIVSGVTKGRKLNGKATREIPYLAVYNVQDRALRLDQVKTIEATEDEIARYRLQKDDLLLTEGGDPDKLGRGTLWDDELPECIHQNHIFRVRLRSRDLDAVFLNWLIGSERGKRYFLRSAKQTTGIASINMGQLRGFSLLMPPVELQREFRDRLEQLRAIKDRAAQHANELDALFASLQHRAFRGEL
jgi:type I restriction enzyme S subunit